MTNQRGEPCARSGPTALAFRLPPEAMGVERNRIQRQIPLGFAQSLGHASYSCLRNRQLPRIDQAALAIFCLGLVTGTGFELRAVGAGREGAVKPVTAIIKPFRLEQVQGARAALGTNGRKDCVRACTTGLNAI